MAGLLDLLFSGQGGGLLGNVAQPQPNAGQAQLFGPSGNPYPGGMDPTSYALKALEPPQSSGLLFNANNGVLGNLRNALGQISDPDGRQRQQAVQNYIQLKQLGIQEKAAEEKPQVIQVDDPATGLKRAVLVQPFGKGAQWLDIKDPAGGSSNMGPPASLGLPPNVDVKTAREASAKAAVANQEEAVNSAKSAAAAQPLIDEVKAAYEDAVKVGAVGPVAGNSVRRYIDTGLASVNNALGMQGPEVSSGGAGPQVQEAARQRYDKAVSALQMHANAFKGQGQVSNYERTLAQRQYPDLTALNPADQQAILHNMAEENRRTIEAGKIPSLGQAPQVGAVLNRGPITPGTATPAPPMSTQQPMPVQPQGPGGGLIRMNSPQDAMKLPPGTRFIDANGVTRVRP